MKNLKIQFAVLLLSTVCLLTGAYGQITPSQDAYTNSADPTTNYGTAVTLGVVSSATSIQSTYIQFDLSSIPAGYTSTNVAKATLKLYVNAVTTAGSFNVDYVNGTWTEKTIKASLAPALGGTIVASVPLTSSNVHDYVLIDVTSAVGAWLNGTQTNDGIALVANSPLSATIDSKESTTQSHPAELDVVFNGAIAGITTASGSGLTGGGTSGTLNLSLTTACATNQVLQWKGSSWACAAAGTGTVTSVGSGAGLAGGPITGSGMLSIATGGVTNAMLANSYAQLGAANTFTGIQTVNNTLTANSSGNGIVGNTTGTSSYGVEGSSPAIGVFGLSLTATGGGTGVAGQSNGSTGAGVSGINTAATGSAPGVSGSTSSSSGYGVQGTSPYIGMYGTGTTAGVSGVTTTIGGYGVEGTSPSIGVYGTGVAGVDGVTTSTGGYGVEGFAKSTSGTSTGVYGANYSTTGGAGVMGSSLASTGTAAGVYGTSNSPSGYGVQGAGINLGVYGTANSSVGVGVEGSGAYSGVLGTGSGFGVTGLTTGSAGIAGIFAVSSSSATILQGTKNGIVEFNVDAVGDVTAAGAVSKFSRCEAPFLLRHEIECRITPSLPAQKPWTPPPLQASSQDAPPHRSHLYLGLYGPAAWKRPAWPAASSESPGSRGPLRRHS